MKTLDEFLAECKLYANNRGLRPVVDAVRRDKHVLKLVKMVEAYQEEETHDATCQVYRGGKCDCWCSDVDKQLTRILNGDDDGTE